MVNTLKYILNGFGYTSIADFKSTVFKISHMDNAPLCFLICSAFGVFRSLLNEFTGLDTPVFVAFIFLIGAEFFTGIKVSLMRKGEKFKSRKFGRMILKIGVYVCMIMMLHAFARNMDTPVVMGFPVNPFLWLYYSVFIAIVFQLFISWLENLGALGYKETKSIAGLVLRKFNKWFEFDGSKDNGQE